MQSFAVSNIEPRGDHGGESLRAIFLASPKWLRACFVGNLEAVGDTPPTNHRAPSEAGFRRIRLAEAVF
jgi:hypothetical protein